MFGGGGSENCWNVQRGFHGPQLLVRVRSYLVKIVVHAWRSRRRRAGRRRLLTGIELVFGDCKGLGCIVGCHFEMMKVSQIAVSATTDEVEYMYRMYGCSQTVHRML